MTSQRDKDGCRRESAQGCGASLQGVRLLITAVAGLLVACGGCSVSG